MLHVLFLAGEGGHPLLKPIYPSIHLIVCMNDAINIRHKALMPPSTLASRQSFQDWWPHTVHEFLSALSPLGDSGGRGLTRQIRKEDPLHPVCLPEARGGEKGP